MVAWMELYIYMWVLQGIEGVRMGMEWERERESKSVDIGTSQCEYQDQWIVIACISKG